MEEKLNEMVIENTINEVEENLADEVVQTATKNNGVVTGLVIGGIALAGFAIYKVIKARRNAKHNQEVEVEDDEFFEEETETED
nr:MAG TPA: Integrin alpha-IIb, Integrin beta-3, transmembrane signaling, protein structure [Caudoviricetes sp.]